MSKGFAVTFSIGLAVVGIFIWVVFYKQQGAHIDPKGSILKVRTLKLDENSSAAIVEVRITNTADYALVARTIEMAIDTDKNNEVQGNTVAEMDVKSLFKNYPILGEQYNPVLKARDKTPPHTTIDREVCAQFTMPVEELDRRKDIVVRIQDITGPTLELHELRH